ncbi:MAG: peptidylprolyl isomerase [Bacteroidetes bacterium]|nr:peptidylprolyl isomerase [Bacteroidota bacterium]
MVKRFLYSLALLAPFLIFTSYIFPDNRTKILISTSLGDIKIVLYDETPKHRDNFLKLVKNHTLDSTLFHRVIQGFMIQGGDIDSKHAKPGVALGNGELGYTIPAEFNTSLFHKRGALAGARQSDDVNPNKESSSCQFYIVQGRVFNDSMLDVLQAKMDQPIKQQIFNTMINDPANITLRNAFVNAQNRYKAIGNADSLNFLSEQINPKIESEFAKTPHYKFTEEKRSAYKTIGGAPHLDGAYTVFGEVVEGMDIVDKIASQAVDQAARPAIDIRVTMKIIK